MGVREAVMRGCKIDSQTWTWTDMDVDMRRWNRIVDACQCCKPQSQMVGAKGGCGHKPGVAGVQTHLHHVTMSGQRLSSSKPIPRSPHPPPTCTCGFLSLGQRRQQARHVCAHHCPHQAHQLVR